MVVLLDDRQIEVERRDEGLQRARFDDYSEASRVLWSKRKEASIVGGRKVRSVTELKFKLCVLCVCV